MTPIQRIWLYAPILYIKSYITSVLKTIQESVKINI